MKFWRRHKHELARSDGDEPLPAPPDKKMRYSKEDDVLLAKYFFNKPDGTSDKIFQAFGRLMSFFVSCFSGYINLMISFSTPIILGKGGRNTTGYTKRRSSTSCNF